MIHLPNTHGHPQFVAFFAAAHVSTSMTMLTISACLLKSKAPKGAESLDEVRRIGGYLLLCLGIEKLLSVLALWGPHYLASSIVWVSMTTLSIYFLTALMRYRNSAAEAAVFQDAAIKMLTSIEQKVSVKNTAA